MGKDHDLLEAARNGNIAVVSKILDHISKRNSGPLASFRRNPSINLQDMNGYTPLHHACLNGHSNIVRLLLGHEATPDMPDIRGSTPLYLASWAGHDDIVQMLLLHPKKPANPNSQTIENETPLHCAAQHGHNAVLTILLAHGANPAIRNNSFQTALDLAAQFGRLQAVEILIRTHPELIEPFKANHIPEATNSYADLYESTSTKHIFTHSCLHLASRNGHKKVIETLLAAGLDVNILTNTGTALHEAALCGKKSVVCTLLQAGIDTSATDGNGRTALDILSDYPPHVTYEIVSAINEFCNQRHNVGDKLTPIASTNEEFIEDDNDNTNCPDVIQIYNNNNNNIIRDKSYSMPANAFEKNRIKANTLGVVRTTTADDDDSVNDNHNEDLKDLVKTTVPLAATTNKIPKQLKFSGLSNSMSSLDKTALRPEFYLKMEPIRWERGNKKQQAKYRMQKNTLPVTYKPIYRQCPLLTLKNEALEIRKSSEMKEQSSPSSKPYEYIHLASTGGSSSEHEHSSSSNRDSPLSSHPSNWEYRCIDEYVEMSEPIAEIQNQFNNSPTMPLPSPRRRHHFETDDYANIAVLKNERKAQQQQRQKQQCSIQAPHALNVSTSFSSKTSCMDVNNNSSKNDNNNNQNDNTNKNNNASWVEEQPHHMYSSSFSHASTPECPPPSVTQAERTILEFIQPVLNKRYKRNAIRFQKNDVDLDLDEDVQTTITEEIPKSPVGSQESDCVEEFVGDVPFAGLFKGSSLNLANEEDIDDVDGDANNPLVRCVSRLRSPSLVRSIVVKPTPTKRSLSQTQKEQISSSTDYCFNEAKVWEEINTILESIGNEFSTVDEPIVQENCINRELTSNNEAPVQQKHKQFQIRDPADLTLDITHYSSSPTNWCHSSNTLIYGQILYEVFYLGSTVIRNLHGTVSTRKSIQKFKREISSIEEVDEANLVEDCNSSTKILKANNHKCLKVGISVSCIGVKFIDNKSKATISIHDIENINCVCQDADDLRYFAYITKENDLHYCHVFMVHNVELATEIILTLGQAFEVAYQLALKRNSTIISANDDEMNVSVD